jgi:aminoglycoside phosphotransferase (APT) family kinase protein
MDPDEERTMGEACGPLVGEGRTAEVFVWNETQVLKLFRGFMPPKAALREFDNSQAVFQAGVPVPRPGGVAELDGRTGLVFQKVDGPTMLRRVASRPWTIVTAAHTLAGLHSDMHDRAAPALQPLEERLDRNVRAAPDLPEAARHATLRRLEGLPDGESICHGDFHPDNVLMSPQGPVIIDWSIATRGDPNADVARTSLMLSLGSVPSDTPARTRIDLLRRLFHYLYMRHYLRLRGVSRGQVEVWRLPVAAARLNERISGEREVLLNLILRLAARQEQP